MYEFLVQNSIFVVLIIALMIWFGLATFLLFLDRKLIKLEERVENLSENIEK